MKAFALIGAALALGSATPAETVAPAPDVPDAAIAVVVCGGARAGTAFRIGPHRLVTAAHVTSHASCTLQDRAGGGDVPVEVVREEGRLDIAELRSAAASDVFLQVDCGGVRRGRHYRAIGFAGGRYRANLPLIATGYATSFGGAEFVGETIPGMSGGPVIDRRGRVVAVVNTRLPASARALRETWLCRR